MLVITTRREAVISRVDATGSFLSDKNENPCPRYDERARESIEREYYVLMNYPSKKPTSRKESEDSVAKRKELKGVC